MKITKMESFTSSLVRLSALESEQLRLRISAREAHEAADSHETLVIQQRAYVLELHEQVGKKNGPVKEYYILPTGRMACIQDHAIIFLEVTKL